MELTIKTDRKWKFFKDANEVPKKVITGDFSHLDPNDSFDGFIQYRRRWYHLSDFMRVDSVSPLKGWQGYLSDTFFSGVVLKVSNDGESYKIGTFFS